jgi:hypothetical protein
MRGGHLFIEWKSTNFYQYAEGEEERIDCRQVYSLSNLSIPFRDQVYIYIIFVAEKMRGAH